MSLPYYDTHICLISKELAPNFLPIRLKDAKPKKMVLLVSSVMVKRAGIFEVVLAKHGITVERIDVADGNVATIEDKLNTYFEENKESSKIALNMTGGTKPMSFAALEMARMHEISCFYVDTQEKKLLFFEGHKIREEKLDDVLKYQDLLALNGYNILNDDPRAIKKENREIAELLVKNAGHWEKNIGELNFYAQIAEQRLEIARKQNSEASNFSDLLLKCQDANLLIYDDKRIKFTDDESRKFCNGGWLEDYIYSYIRKLYDDKKITSCTKNIEIIEGSANKKPTKNELDTVFTVNNKLFIIEAKTKRIADKDFDTEKNKRSNDIVYKLETLKDKLGGIFSTSIFISYRSLSDSDKKRAKSYNIKIIANNELKNLSQEIEKLIK